MLQLLKLKCDFDEMFVTHCIGSCYVFPLKLINFSTCRKVGFSCEGGTVQEFRQICVTKIPWKSNFIFTILPILLHPVTFYFDKLRWRQFCQQCISLSVFVNPSEFYFKGDYKTPVHITNILPFSHCLHNPVVNMDSANLIPALLCRLRTAVMENPKKISMWLQIAYWDLLFTWINWCPNMDKYSHAQ